jgi:hypothetical protein
LHLVFSVFDTKFRVKLGDESISFLQFL